MELFLTLTLKQENGALTGGISDNMAFLTNEISDIGIKDQTLVFNVIANVEESPTVTFRLKISQDQLAGEWKSTDGVSGKWTARRQSRKTAPSNPQSGNRTAPVDTSTIIRWMAEHRVPGISMAVIDKYKTAEIESIGTISNHSKEPVTENTYFQAASVSKAVTAAIVFHCIDRNMFDLDTDVNRYLKSWKVPQNRYTRQKKVTLRGLMSHRAGMPATNFPQKKGAGDPTLVQILNGESPALNKPAFPVLEPGTRWQYSNLGYVVIQQILEDTLQKPFVQIADEIVFKPLGMTHSTFRYPIPTGREGVEARPHRIDGTPGEPMMNSAAQAHGGLMTTARDLAVFVVEIMNAWRQKSTRLISPESAGIMINEGVGVFNRGSGTAVSFYHPGQGLPGATGWIVGYPHSGQGAVILTNGYKGLEPTRRITGRLETLYQWPKP
jgi:CubicO group peptidase (beta-lactamase class C family)